MKRLFIVILASVLVAVQADAQTFSKLSVLNYGIESIWPSGFSSVTGSAWAEIDNSGEGFTLKGIKGTVYREGQPFVTGTARDLHIGRGKGRHTLNGTASLCPGVSLFSILRLLSFDPKVYSVDISVTIVMDNGESRNVSLEKFPVSELLKLK